ncbi:MAG: RNA polymerase sigma factor [Rhodoferax sp.]
MRELTTGPLPTPATAAQPTDASLIQRILAGQTELYGQLVQRHQQRISRFVASYEHSVQEAQELTQETFLQGFASLARFHGQAQFSTWLTGIALNLIRNHIGRNPGRRFVHLDISDCTDSVLCPESEEPEQQQARKERLVALTGALSTLAPEMREAIVLVVLQELSYQEAAQLLKVPPGTVKSRVCRARTQLADALRPHIADL